MTFSFDLDLGIKNQAIVLLKHLSSYDYEFFGIKDKYDFNLTTSALYNGRENGVVLQVVDYTDYDNALLIYFSECRSSDGMFVTHYAGARATALINPPTLEDFPEHTYETRKYFDYADYRGAGEHIVELITNHVRIMYNKRLERESKKEKHEHV